MLKKLFKSREFWIISGLVFINMILRLPSVFQDLQPFDFCDEALITGMAYGQSAPGVWDLDDYYFGGMNYYLPAIIAKTFRLFGVEFRTSISTFTIYLRILFCVILSSLSVPFIYLAVKSLFKEKNLAYLAVAIFTLSPMALGLSKIAYPDHYVVFFSSAVLYFCAKIIEVGAAGSEDIRKWYIRAGLFIGFAIGVKYYSLMLLLPLGLAHVSRFSFRESMLSLNTWKRMLKSRDIWIGVLAMFGGFLICCPTVISYFGGFLKVLKNHAAHYSGNHKGIESDHGFLFYSEVLYLTSFGVLGVVLTVIGAFKNIKSENLWKALVLILTPIVFAAMLGRYRVVINRNVSAMMPYLFILEAVGLWYLLQLNSVKNRKYLKIFIIVLFFAEPTFKSLFSFVHDFFPDARKAAVEWTAKNVPAKAPIGAAYACWGLPIGGGDRRLETIPTVLAPVRYGRVVL